MGRAQPKRPKPRGPARRTDRENPIKFTETPLAGAFVIEPERRGDERGFFARVFCEEQFARQGLATHFVQINNSLSSAPGTLRGMHYQLPPHAETKVVRCIRGALWDCILDLRRGSPTFGGWYGTELSADNRRMMYVPKGFAHGFVTLEADAEMLYFVDAAYHPDAERGVRHDDAEFGIQWPAEARQVSEKDRSWPNFDEAYHLGA